MSNYIEIDFFAGSVRDAVNKLLEYKQKGILACLTFNRVTLYSDTVDLDSAYIQITGRTADENDKLLQESFRKYEESIKDTPLIKYWRDEE